VSDAAALPEVIGDAGEYVGPNDTEDIVRGLEHVLNDEMRYDELVTAGKERVSRYAWEKTGEELTARLKQE
ncbi:MAG: hypothetical protein ABEI86_04450, partial [Halobacteriaceae archaeon]